MRNIVAESDTTRSISGNVYEVKNDHGLSHATALGSQQTGHALRSVECNIVNCGDGELDFLAVFIPGLLFLIIAITRHVLTALPAASKLHVRRCPVWSSPG
jgi:hypothetical protein